MLSLECFAFINGCLRYKEEDRMSTEELISHKYINNPHLENKAHTTRDKQHMVKLEILNMKPHDRE